MATKSVKTTRKTSAPKVSRARKTTADVAGDAELMTQAGHTQIAMRAYELFCARGYQHGHDVEDWLAAERELTAN
jgi:hypothetical protein